MKVLIRGVLTTSSFVHQTSPDTKGEHIKTSVIGSDGNRLYDVPYVTANSVRGLIRRAAARVLFESMESQGIQISRNMFLSLVRGTFSRTSVNAGGAAYEQRLASSAHIFSGLFGGGSFMYPSAVRLERDLIPVLTSTSALMPKQIQDRAINVFPRDILSKTLMAPRDDFERLPPDARTVVEDLETAYREHMSTKVDQAASKKIDDTEKKDDLNNFTQTECIIPGVPLSFGLVVDSATPAQVGLLLLALSAWVNKNALGGGSVRGRGSFIPALSLYVDGKEIAPNLFTGDAPHLMLADHPEIEKCLTACVSELNAAVIPASLENIYPSKALEKEAKPKKEKASKKSKTEETAEAGAA
jgi:CRISPR type IV-associated protein Csf2